MVEFQSLAKDAIVETILQPDVRSQVSLLRGVTLDMSSKHRVPYVSRTVWKFLGGTVNQRSVLKSLGVSPRNSRALDPHVLQALGDVPMTNEHLRKVQ